jgi:thiol:disulfide interchange protein
MVKKKSKKTSKKEESGNHDFAMLGFVLGILSIVFIFLNQIGGLILGIFGLMQCKKQKNALSEKAKGLNWAGIIINGILILLVITSIINMAITGDISNLLQTSQFPTA